MNEENYELWAIWDRNCWKCGNIIKVALNTEGWSFNPFGEIGIAWNNTINERIRKALKQFGVKLELRYSKTVKHEYIANVCSYCNAIQGEWFIRKDFLEFLYKPREDFKLILFKNGEIIDTFSSIEEFQNKYVKYKLIDKKKE
jgi:hypothetical protein